MSEFPATSRPATHGHDSEARPYKVGFVLVPQFSMLPFSAALEPLRSANRLGGGTLYEWVLAGSGVSSVEASNGIRFEVGDLSCLADADMVLVCAGEGATDQKDDVLDASLRKLTRRRVILGGVCTGSYVLARAGLLDGYRCTIHWENIASQRERFPQVIVSSELFEMDRDRYTASGGTAPLDMMLNVIAEQHGAQLAAAISEAFICERIRGRNDRQRVPLKQFLGTGQPKLIEAVALMEANVEEPMSLDELSRHVGLSRRQLERLFQKHLSCVPTRYYLELRLARARQLLLQTSMSIVDVAFASGFVSAPHFSKCYRDFFGFPPRDERRLKGARPAPTSSPGVLQPPLPAARKAGARTTGLN
ncbi:MAG: GlxA family transcriptional regulator [Gammaproteobacteria bacterium]